LIEYLSSRVTLYPGDLVLTGTPSGVALGRPDQPWLKPGDVLRTWVEGVGALRQTFVAPAVA
jgi:2-keto-4-pentenoate hydratase/2-oxohepta-3-ene-1,7-dioic acid hydratase in catechol pathway